MAALGWFLFFSKWYLLNWAALPCIALLAGALPVAITRGKVNGDAMNINEQAVSHSIL